MKTDTLPEFLRRDYFEALQKKLFALLRPKEHLFLSLSGESSQFIRLNAAKIRQIGTVADGEIQMTLVHESAPGVLHKCEHSLTLSGISYLDQQELQHSLQALQQEARQLPADPYAQLPTNHGTSSVEKRGSMPSIEDAPGAILDPVGSLDLAGIYAAGPCIRAMADSAGTSHWFSSERFSFDFSLYTPAQRAVKANFSGQTWDPSGFTAKIQGARRKLSLLQRPARKLERGDYRVFLEPDAFCDLIQMFSWGAIGEASIRQGDSPFQMLRSGREKLSPIFSLSEDFRPGDSPRFNAAGELAPERLVLFERGEFKNSLISTRTSKEYGLKSNFASTDEALRAPSVPEGDLAESDVLKRLGTGLYVSNLHYLNWSDQPGGRITGMTRYACFWVENGEMACPMENMRFDDTIFRFFGSSLEALTDERAYHATTYSYGKRALGGIWAPGALLSGMKFTL